MTTKQTTKQPKTPFISAPTPWAWNETPAGGLPSRDRCQSIGTHQEKAKAVELIAEYRRQEEISRTHDIAGMSDELDKLGRQSQNYIGAASRAR
jgi:hypothetical protein